MSLSGALSRVSAAWKALRRVLREAGYALRGVERFGRGGRYCYARRGRQLRILRVPDGLRAGWLQSEDPDVIIDLVAAGAFDDVELARLIDDFTVGPWISQPKLLRNIKRSAGAVRASAFQPTLTDGDTAGDRAARFFEQAIGALRRSPDLIDFVGNAARARAAAYNIVPFPFDKTADLPAFKVPAAPVRKSVLFLHNSYYHFNTLAAALRQRGWDALTVSVEAPSSPQRQFYMGEDVNLFHGDHETRIRQIRDFIRSVPERFGALHFYGYPNFFAENVEREPLRTRIPFDMLELRRHGVIVGYSPSGCLDGVRQSTIKALADNICGHCVWELRPDVCSDARNGAWADTIDAVCDWVCLGGDFAFGARVGPKFVRESVTFTLDPGFWTSDLEIAESRRVPRREDEILVYHAVGYAELRQRDGRDIKGSRAVEAAIARLRADGIPVRLFFAKDIPISEVRYYKAQADIVVDQLNYGRIGANARESFMMGKPLITRLKPQQQAPQPPLRSVLEAPALNASEQTVEAVLRRLVLDRGLREEMARHARAYALRWYAADACARRFEIVIDRVRRGLPPETPELYPEPVFNPFAEPNFGPTARAS